MKTFCLWIAGAITALDALTNRPIAVEGEVAIRANENVLEITSGESAVLHWEDFSIGESETFRFIQPNVQSVALNRVVSSIPSTLLGRLESIGQVILINPNGILVGKHAVIDTGSLIASTLDIQESVFSGELHFRSSKKGSLVLDGLIQTKGPALFLGELIDSRGTILSSSNVFLGSGSDATLFLGMTPKIGAGTLGEEMGIQHSGSIESPHIYFEAPASPILQNGTLIATQGEVRILGIQNRLTENSWIDVSGANGAGTILIGGDFKGQNPNIPNSSMTWVDSDSILLANAEENGKGGKVILWGTDYAYFRGQIEARGGNFGGDGGFVEISSKGVLDSQGSVDTRAPFGKNGTLFLDPCTVTISAAMNSGITTFPPPGYTFSGTSANISNMAATTLQTYLTASAVTIDASASGTAAVGSITLAAGSGGVSWPAANKLTLIADGFIDIFDLISATNAGASATTPLIEISAPVVTIGGAANPGRLETTSGQIIVNAPTSLSVLSNSAVNGGIRAGTGALGAIELNTGTLLLSNALGGNEALIEARNEIDINATGDISVIAALREAQIRSSGGGDITILGSGNLTLLGGISPGGPTLSRALIREMAGGDIFIEISGDYSLISGTPGPGTDGSAGIALTAGTGSVTLIGGNYLISSGTSATGTAISTIGMVTGASGTVSVTSRGANGITITANGQLAQIGTFFAGGSGNIVVNTTNLYMNGATNPATMNGFAFIGANGSIQLNASGDLVLRGGPVGFQNGAGILSFFAGASVSVRARNIQLFAGGGPSCFASIQSQAGPATVAITGDYFIQGGGGVGSFAGILSSSIGGSGDLIVSGRNYTLIGGSGTGAGAAFATGDPGTMIGGNGSLYLSATGSLNLTGGSGVGAAAFISTFGTLGTNALSISAPLPSSNLTLTSPNVGGPGSEARITTRGGGIDIFVGNDVTLTSTPGNTATISVGNLGTSDLLLQAGHSANIGSLITNQGTGNITLVVDANFPSSPLLGPGSFTLGPSASVTTTAGSLRIFTSQQALNSILGTLNGSTFNPGTLFLDTSQEIWCVYYPSFQGGSPFTIFYKDCIQLVAYQAQLIISENLVNLHPYKFGWWERFSISSNMEDEEFWTPYYLIRKLFLYKEGNRI